MTAGDSRDLCILHNGVVSVFAILVSASTDVPISVLIHVVESVHELEFGAEAGRHKGFSFVLSAN